MRRRIIIAYQTAENNRFSSWNDKKMMERRAFSLHHFHRCSAICGGAGFLRRNRIITNGRGKPLPYGHDTMHAAGGAKRKAPLPVPARSERPPCLRRREAKGLLAYAGAKRKAPLPKGGCRGERSETRLGDNSCCLMRKVSLHRAGAVPLPLGKGGFFAGRRGRRPLRGTRAGQGPPPVR